jgi:DNA helicase II / ATP-dependent DNA helicase PcrA
VIGLAQARDELRQNDRQWEAFITPGHCVVVAPPGSGKTKLLTTRVAEDLTTLIKSPRGASCITLTNAAADEVARRLGNLGVKRSTLFVGTVHAFALSKIVVPYAAVVGWDDVAGAAIANPEQQKTAFGKAVSSLYAPSEDTRFLRPTMDRARRMLASPDELQRFGPRMAGLIEAYEANLRESGLIDFDDLVKLSVRLVEENRFVRRALASRYRCLYVDEYQDLPPGLDRLVRALCFGDVDVRLFAVGDPDQSIFGWTGSRPELLDELAVSPAVALVRLNVNYRCGAKIIAYSRRVLEHEREISAVREGGEVEALHCPGGIDEQRQQTARLIIEAREAGTLLEEIAVICRTNDDCIEMGATLRQQRIPCFVRAGYYSLTQATLFVEGLAAWTVFPRGSGGRSLSHLLRTWRVLLGMNATPSDDVDLVRYVRESSAKPDQPASEFLQGVLDIGLARSLRARVNSQDADEIGKMRAALGEGELSNLTLRGLADRARPVGRVEVTTMSSAKGLEFDVVILTGLEEGLVPFWSSTKDPRELAEERRKFYVSITRARRAVHLLYSGWFTWKSGASVHDGPSRFLSELGLV